MVDRMEIAGLSVNKALYDLVDTQILPGTGVDLNTLWSGFADILRDLAPKNQELLQKRDTLQTQIDQWHRSNRGPQDLSRYKKFLVDIGYLTPEGDKSTLR